MQTEKNTNNVIKTFLRYKWFFLVFFLLIFCSAYTIIPNENSSASKFLLNKVVGVLDMVGESKTSAISKTDGYTAMLIMGIDSRDLKFDGETFEGKDRNTDTIIQVIYEYETNNIFLISIPRDTGFAVDEDCITQGYDKAINRIYKATEDGGCDMNGAEMMMKYTSKITGFENHYYSLISFETFYEVFEVIGEESFGEKGLWVDVPEAVYEYYPKNNGFEYFELAKGNQFLDSEQLLRFARSRKNSSDFVRAGRQQIVIEALKDRIVSMGLSDPSKITELYNSFRDNALYSEIGSDEILGGLGLIEEVQEAEIYNVIIDDTLGGQNNYMVRPAFSPPNGVHYRNGFYLTPVDYDKECCKVDNFLRVKKYLKSIVSDPEVYEEDAKVALYSSSGTFDELPIKFENWKKSEPPVKNVIKSQYSFKKDIGDDIVIVDLSKEKKTNTLNYLSEELGAKIVSVESVEINPAHQEDIAIILKSIE